MMSQQTNLTTTEALLRAKDMTETTFRTTLAELRITLGDFLRLRDAHDAMTLAAREYEVHERGTKTDT